MYQLASSSITDSFAYILGFMNYIDDIFVWYISRKIGLKKSRRITTKLDMALINNIVESRSGAMHFYRVGNTVQISFTNFYAGLRSLKNGFGLNPLS